MAGKKASIILVLMLVGASLALGTVFHQTGGWAGPGGAGPSQSSDGVSHTYATKLVLSVEAIKPTYWNASATVRPPADFMFAPVGSIPVTVTLKTESTPHPIHLSTNSSGLATFFLANGSYALQTETPTLSFDIFVNVTKGFTTFVHVKVFPRFSPIDYYVLSSKDTASVVEPSSLLFAKVTSSLPSGPPIVVTRGQFVQLVESVNSTQLGTLTGGKNVPEGTFRLNATALGSYPSTKGIWVSLEVSPPPSSLPATGMQIMVFVPTYTVSQYAT